MPNIVLSRIDERLIHGQVGVQWVGFAGANLVLVANDEVAEDPVQQNLMEMVLAEGIAVRFWTLQKAAGVECFVQGVPTEPAVDLFKLL